LSRIIKTFNGSGKCPAEMDNKSCVMRWSQDSETPGSVERPSPLVGEHNELILKKYLGISGEEIRELKEEGTL
jgi:crotonobetainyl-CoA:carnitine CoA-transferase CaiB-like acyl-CoA transferase